MAYSIELEGRTIFLAAKAETAVGDYIVYEWNDGIFIPEDDEDWEYEYDEEEDEEEDEVVITNNGYDDDEDDDDTFDEDKLTEESYRTTFDTNPEDLNLEAVDVADDEY